MSFFQYFTGLADITFRRFEDLEDTETVQLLNVLSFTGLVFSIFCTITFTYIDWVAPLRVLTVGLTLACSAVLFLIKAGKCLLAKNLYLFSLLLSVVMLIWYFSSRELPHLLLLISFGQAFLLFTKKEVHWNRLHIILSISFLLLAELNFFPEKGRIELSEWQQETVREFFVIASILMNSWLVFIFSSGKKKIAHKLFDLNQKLEAHSQELDIRVRSRTNELKSKEDKLQKLLNESNEQNEQLISKEMELIKMIDELELIKRQLKGSLAENELAREKVNLLLDESQLSNKILQVQEDILKANLKMQKDANVSMREAQLEQQKFVATVEHSSDLIALFDFEGKFLYLNQSGMELVRLPKKSEAEKLHISELVDDENYLKLISEVEPVLKSEGSWRGEISITIPSSHEQFTMDASFFTVFDPSGKVPLCRATIMRDITKNKLLSDEHRLLSMVASKTTNAVVITEPNGKVEWVNEAFTKITGYTLREVMGKKPGELLQGPDTSEQTVQTIRQKLKNKESFTVEILNYHKSGSNYWLEMNISPVLDECDNVINFIAIESDITRRKIAELELQKANEQLLKYTDELQHNNEELSVTQEAMLQTQRILKEREREQQKFVALSENSFDLLLLADMGGNLIFQNQACKKLFGFSPRKKNLFSFLKGFVENKLEVDNMQSTGKAGGVWKGELNIKVPSQEKEVMVDGLFFLVQDNKDERRPICQALLMHDITDLKSIEGNLRKVNEELEDNSKILRRTNTRLSKSKKRLEKALVNEWESKKELQKAIEKLKSTQSQLIQSEKMASLGQLTAGIAHEINNPVNFVYAGSETLSHNLQQLMEILNAYVALEKQCPESELVKVNRLKEDFEFEVLKEDVFGLLDDIKIGAERTAEIVKGLRNFSRLDEHEMKLANINQGLDSTLVLLRSQFKDRVKVVKNYGEIPALTCYPGQVNQVFMNILSNAIQAIQGEGQITITTFEQDQEIVIIISDTGQGIPTEIKEKVFDPFFTTKEVGEGTGLGLSISYGIVKKHQGSIELESELGKGSHFTIKLPILN